MAEAVVGGLIGGTVAGAMLLVFARAAVMQFVRRFAEQARAEADIHYPEGVD